MTTLATTTNTLADIVARTAPDGSIEREIASRVARKNEILQVLPWKEGNKADGNQIVRNTKLPTVGYQKFNAGTAKSKAGFEQKTDSVGVIKVFSDIDCELAKMNNYEAGFRRSEDMAFAEAMNQQFASDLVYGNTVLTPEKFVGLAPRYAAAGTVRNNESYYMINGGGTSTDNTSIWVLSLGEDGVYGIYGKGGQAGLKMTDHGKVWVTDASSNDYQVFRSEWRWEVGLQVKRPGAAVRICNIDKSNLTGETSAADLSVLLQRAMNLIEDGLGQKVILCNKTTRAWLGIQASKESTLGLHMIEDTFGKPIPSFWGTPILLHDGITNAEATVTGTFQSDI
jgi:hypothetical protein